MCEVKIKSYPSVGISHKASPYESFFMHGSCINIKRVRASSSAAFNIVLPPPVGHEVRQRIAS
ncbi:MAG TPA: hypothetical protein PLV94_13000, partial [Spirochaetota bacterium]|nr:hypothetical protein [Spirochaetota bacterium]